MSKPTFMLIGKDCKPFQTIVTTVSIKCKLANFTIVDKIPEALAQFGNIAAYSLS